jgi:hypothetical protein
MRELRASLWPVAVVALALPLVACKKAGPGEGKGPSTKGDAGPAAARYDRISRADFNRLAVRLNLPLYWSQDRDRDGAVDPDEVVTLRFYPTSDSWSAGGKLTPAFAAAYEKLVAAAAAAKAPAAGTPEEQERLRLVGLDLDAARPTLVYTDLRTLSPKEQEFARHMLAASDLIDVLYLKTNGATAMAAQVADDPASRSLFRRNMGPECASPAMEREPKCSAIPGAPRVPVDVYPAAIQEQDGFCETLAARPDASALLTPFTAVRAVNEKFSAVPYTVVYKDEMGAIAKELTAAAAALPPEEGALAKYLTAAAKSFETNDWQPADEAWAAMNTENSGWYVRVAPDETYWEPCARKAGFHLTFARINRDSLVWQQKLVPVRQDMEQAIAERAGKPYAARNVSFHLPDFIEIVTNAGDDRDAIGATIGQSLPNWGPVAEQGRGRTVAMSNLYTDTDSLASRRAQAGSLIDAASLAVYVDDKLPGLLGTILHEATHNLGPAHEYKAGGKTDDEIFGGPLAATMEELKAQTGALFLVELIRSKKLIDDQLAVRTYADSLVWALGHIGAGMYTKEGKPKPYSQLAAIQIGFLIDRGALAWDPEATAANGKDKGAFTIHWDKMPAACDEMMRVVAGIKARGDVAGAKKLIADYVDGKKVPLAVIAERWAREPRVNFVYSVDL